MNKDYFKNRDVDGDVYENFSLPYFLTKLLPKDKNAHILDIGCGFGQYLRAMRRMGYINIKGADISDAAVDFCKKDHLDVYKVESIAEFAQTSNDKFDLIVMTHVLEHIKKDDIIDTLSLIKGKLLKKGSLIFISVPNAQSNTGCYWAYEDFTHTTLFTAGSLLYALRSAGFSKIEIIDPYGIEKFNSIVRVLKFILLQVYILNKEFWNKVTSSSYHKQSPKVFSFEIKAVAIND